MKWFPQALCMMICMFQNISKGGPYTFLMDRVGPILLIDAYVKFSLIRSLVKSLV